MSHAVVVVTVDGPEDQIEEQVATQMFPFDAGREDAGMFADGTRWDWYMIGGRYDGMLQGGNILQKKKLNLSLIHTQQVERLTECWKESQGREEKLREFIYDVKPNETLEEFLSRKAETPEQSLSFYAFLHNKHWHEAGWFGDSTATECERKNPDYPLDNNKCLHVDESTGARIINWQEPWEVWSQRYFKRFIDPLPENKFLVLVDFHV